MRKIILVIGLAFLINSGETGAQSAGSIVERGIAAYRAGQYDNAAALLWRGLALGGLDTVSGMARTEALGYLGAAETFRGDTVAARSAFVQALVFDPRYRVDDLIFPPVVSRVFDSARFTTALTTVRVPRDTVIASGSLGITFHLFASAPHEVVVSIVAGQGGTVRRLYEGPIGDSLAVSWNGVDSSSTTAMHGAYVLRVQSSSASATSETTVPLNVEGLPVDTLVPPARPEASGIQAAEPRGLAPTKALVIGTIAGAAAIFLPPMMSDEGSDITERYFVGGMLSAAGVFAFFKGKRDIRRAAKNATQLNALEEWRLAYDGVMSENERRKRSRQLRITAEPQTIKPGGG